MERDDEQPAPITFRESLYLRDYDHLGQKNDYIEQIYNATRNFMTKCGLSQSYTEARGICLFAMKHYIKYKCALWDFAGEKYRLRSVMTKGQTGKGTTKSEHPADYVDTTNGRGRKFPAEILGKGRAYLENWAT